jgi:hypothetical protein
LSEIDEKTCGGCETEEKVKGTEASAIVPGLLEYVLGS